MPSDSNSQATPASTTIELDPSAYGVDESDTGQVDADADEGNGDVDAASIMRDLEAMGRAAEQDIDSSAQTVEAAKRGEPAPTADDDDAAGDEGEDDGDEDDGGEQPAALDPAMVERAEKVGMSEDQIRAAGPMARMLLEQAEKIAALSERPATTTNDDPDSDDDDFDTSLLDPGIQKLLKAQDEKIAALEQRLGNQTNGDDAYHRARAEMQIDQFVENLASRIPDVFGDDASDADGAVQKLVRTAETLAGGYRNRLESPPTVEALLEQALRSEFPDAVSKEQLARTKQKLGKRRGAQTARPNKHKKGAAGKSNSDNLNYIRSWMRDYIGDDGAPDDTGGGVYD